MNNRSSGNSDLIAVAIILLTVAFMSAVGTTLGVTDAAHERIMSKAPGVSASIEQKMKEAERRIDERLKTVEERFEHRMKRVEERVEHRILKRAEQHLDRGVKNLERHLDHAGRVLSNIL